MNDDMSNLATQLQREFETKSPSITDMYYKPEEKASPTSQPNDTPSDECKGVKTIPLFNIEEAASSAVGLDYRSVMQELVKPLQRAIMKAGSSSISLDVLGTFLNTFPNDPSWGREELFDTGKLFYVLKNQSREAHVYNLVRQTCQTAEGDIATIPAVFPITLSIDEPGVKFDLNTYALTFTRKELQYIKFAFVRSIDFRYNDESADPYLDACYVIKIDRTKLEAAPFVNNYKE
jgi:hypothetical protein